MISSETNFQIDTQIELKLENLKGAIAYVMSGESIHNITTIINLLPTQQHSLNINMFHMVIIVPFDSIDT